MRNKPWKRPVALLLTALLCITTLSSVFAVDGAEHIGVDVTTKLKDVQGEVWQNGQSIASGGALDFKNDIQIRYMFDVPIKNNAPNDYVQGGDFAVFPLPSGLTLGGITTTPLVDGEVTIGAVTLSGSEARIDFDNYMNEDESITEVSVLVDATMKYDGSQGEEGKQITITVLDKTYTITVPKKETVIDGTKTGTADLANGVVDWVVRVTATWDDGSTGKLAGSVFSDDLTSVGAFVSGSLKVGTTATSSAAPTTAPAVENGDTLSYLFPDGAGKEQYLFFQTQIPEDVLYRNGQQTITNTGVVTSKDGSTKELKGTATFNLTWIEKEGAVVTDSEGSGDKYDPSNRQIRWTISANPHGVSLAGVVITDVLDEQLEFVSATWQKKNSNGAGETPATAITPAGLITSGAYELGNIDTPVLLTIITKVKDTTSSAAIKTIRNHATITWDGNDTGYGSNHVGVPIGIASIAKGIVANGYTASNHQATWKVEVDTRQQAFTDLRVLDLLVYGDRLNYTDIDQVQAKQARAFSEITVDVLKQMVSSGALRASCNQRYVDGSFTTSDALACKVYTVKNKDGKAIADLLVVTGETGEAISQVTKSAFSYKTQITNPDIYASCNANHPKITNWAALFSDTQGLHQDSATYTIDSCMLSKDMLPWQKIADIFADPTSTGAVNQRATVAAGFDYVSKSAVFRIHVNADGLTDATNDLTCVDGVTLGSITVTDTLPAGWKFQKWPNNREILIYEGISVRESGGKMVVQAVTPVAIDSGFLKDITIKDVPQTTSQALSVTFTKLTKPYLILVKAAPTTETAREYFEKNKMYTLKNNAIVSNGNYKTSYSDYEDFQITSTLLKKELDKSEVGNGYLTWTVNYKPGEIVHPDAFIEDSLPVGIDVRTDAYGKLLITESGVNNITVTELILQGDGTYQDGSIVDLSDGTIVTYDGNTRVLKFKMPDTAQAYRLTYITDITGAGKTITNKVKLSYFVPNQADGNVSYTIAQNGSSATLQRGGWLELTKTGENSSPLSGAAFTLYAADESTAIRKGETGTDGTLSMKAIPVGDYILKETKAPTGYILAAKQHRVTVKKEAGGQIVTSIDGQTGSDSNQITIRNFKPDTVGTLVISKTVAGNAGDKTQQFRFNVTLTGENGKVLTDAFPYNGTGGVTGGAITGSGILSLAHGQQVTIFNIPKNTTYQVTEADYSADGYITTKTGDRSIILMDQSTTAAFTNTKNSTGGGGSGGDSGSGGSGGSSGGGGGGGESEVTPFPPVVPPTPTAPVLPITPVEPIVPTEPITPIPPVVPVLPIVPTPPVAPTTPPPAYRPTQVPNPNRQESPDVIMLIDENGVPLGNYEKRIKPDGTYEYIDENGVPLGFVGVPQTGDFMPLELLLGMMLLSLSGVGVGMRYRKKQKITK